MSSNPNTNAKATSAKGKSGRAGRGSHRGGGSGGGGRGGGGARTAKSPPSAPTAAAISNPDPPPSSPLMGARKASIERKESLLSCILCCHAIDNATRFNTVGACGHTGCCSLCSLRMRQLLGTSACPICKADLPRVICIERESQSFDSFQDWGDNIGPTHVFDDQSGIFFLKSDFARVRKLREPLCPKCDKKFATVAALKTHVQDVHQLQYCGICLEHKKVFVGEQDLFTREQLKAHSVKGNPREGFAGHPRCDFCFSRYYSNTELFDHLHKNHFECDICVRSQGVQNRYYKDYHDLENHFRADHFLCEEPECLMKKFVVFKSHLDLQAHMTKEHPHIKISRKIDVHFTVRRASHGNDDDTEQWLRQAGGGDNVINVADFPSLSEGPSTGQMQFWEHQTVTRPRPEDFPELPSAARGGGRFGASAGGGGAFRNALAPPPTPAMLAHMNNQDSWEYPALAAAAEALGANNPLMRFVKPAKGKKKPARPSPTASTGRRTEAPRASTATTAAEEDDEEKAPAVLEDEAADAAPALSKSALVLKIRQVLGTDAKYEVFREECKKYRLGETDVATFYGKVRSMFTSAEDFEKLFMRLMRLSPDRQQVEEVVGHHRRQRERGGASSASSASASAVGADFRPPPQGKKKADKKPKTPPAASGWANALRQSGVAPSAAPVVIRAPRLPSRPSESAAGSIWSTSAASPARLAPVIAESSTEMPTSTKIMSAPVDSLAAMSHSSTGQQPTSYAQSTSRVPVQTSFRAVKSDFPGLPKAGKPIGVQPVTRATWDDQVQAIAQNRTGEDPAAGAGGKKKQKKKAMTLGELAMKFS